MYEIKIKEENKMEIQSNGMMQQMQMRKIDGSGGGQGGMKDIMQSLPQEERAAIKEGLSAMTQQERVAAIEEMKSVDATALSSEDYTKGLLDILDKTNKQTAPSNNFSVYA
jgi:peptidyl-tRNA hydrolase